MSNSKNHNAEHNLIFAGLGLQLGIIAKDKIIRAFTEWLFDKARPLGEILVHQQAITPEQMKTLESAVDAHIQQEGGEQKALASLKNVRTLEDELNHLDDEDINNTILPAVTSQKGTLGIPQPFPTSPATPTGDSQGIIDRFERGSFLDAGNLGELYFAKDKELNRTVVTKYIKPELANEQTNQALFHLEGEVTGALEHPSIVPVYGLNKDSRDRLYYAMRYIQGRKLTRAIQEYHRIPNSEKDSRREAFMSLLQNFHAACLAIEYAHIKSVLHCDIKPDNIMVGDFGEVFVVDWGLAVVQNKNTKTQPLDPQMTTEEGQIPTFRPSESAARGLHINQGGSRSGVGGTPAYMAPEQLQATKLNDILLIGPPSDIYGLGATLYHITTGKAPHLPIKQPRESVDDFYGRIMAGKFPTPIKMNITIPIYLNAIVMRAMALNPQDRYSSARDLAEDVKWFMANNPVTAYETPLHEKQKSEAVTNELMFKYEAQEISLPNPTLIDKNLKKLQEISSIRNNKEVQGILSIRDNPKDLPRTMYSLMNSDLPMDRPVDYIKKVSHKHSNFLRYGPASIIIIFLCSYFLSVRGTTQLRTFSDTATKINPVKKVIPDESFKVKKSEPAIDTTSTYTDPGSKVADGAENGGSGWTLTGAGFIGITVAILFLGVCFKLWKNHLKAKLIDQGKDESVVVPDADDLSPKSISPESISPESISLKSIFEPVKVNNSKLPDTKIIIEMALVPAGKFKMGSPASEKGRSDGETQHEVTLTKPFYMGKYEVTQEQWESVMGKNPSREKGARLPVTDVSWEDCQAFIKKLNDKTKGGYRLPTEAEWEFACRAGTSTAYSFGTKIRLKDSNCSDLKIEKPLPVGSFKPNTYGLYDMHGNVWEWCEDWYCDYPEGPLTDPIGPVVGQVRVLRGGSFKDKGLEVRSSSRVNNSQFSRASNFGFRLAKRANFKAGNSPPVIKLNPAIMPSTGSTMVAPFTEAKAREMQNKLAKSLQNEVEKNDDLGKGINLELLFIPAGKFQMGSPASEKDRKKNETQHKVIVTRPFYMGKYQVTQEQWQAVMGNKPNATAGAKLPVTDVSWEDCQEFIRKINRNGANYRLPTEAEWEYACRAGTITAYSFGDKITPKDANYTDSKLGKPVEVGSYKPNAFGLYDMHGNVWEWCEDWFGDYSTGTVTDPIGPAVGQVRVLRGGSFKNDISFVRSSVRNDSLPVDKLFLLGFRLARTI